ncbi:hypothetical protein CIB95_08995 [Lottiidibacillus patelloidae]|uniref:HTH cro/C1-type domain-containing protein n=1 Tax=Lottiidibacillus patelloidae TaxID=2670334 RepID=A0A263BUP5_9BACI|nr:helix-turn-helix transcriptional regulator [Lottiidibacillus patelloidae]OZM56896.1 hypothetical protein CIB95_08995 [Lottiidibacillus patelloidae]
MLQTKLIGPYICRLRKARDMTQVELADHVHVSHQAVSKWERGDSLPDIATLVELSKLFHVSIDKLLSGGRDDIAKQNIGAVVEKIAADEPREAAKVLNEGKSNVSQLVSLAPIMKTSMLEKVTEEVDVNSFTMQHLVELAPFLAQHTIQAIFEKLENRIVIWQDINSLAPFIDENMLANLIEQTETPPTLDDLISSAPFLHHQLNDLMKQIDLTHISWTHIGSLAPFLSQDVLDFLIDRSSLETVTLEKLASIAPFLQQDKLVSLLHHVEDDKLTPAALSSLAPFLPEDIVNQLVEKILD